jgi:hypothetical protein
VVADHRCWRSAPRWPCSTLNAAIRKPTLVTATLPSWLVQQVSCEEEREVSDLRTEIEVLDSKIDQLMKNRSVIVQPSD